MTLTLDEVRKTKFHMARRTGYEVSEVDLFVDRVEASFAQLTEENESLKQQVEALKQAQAQARQRDDRREPSGQEARQPEKRQAEVPRTQTVAQQARPGEAAERIVVTTSAEASPAVVRLVQMATEQSETLVTEAAAEAKRTIEEANQKAQQITTEARTKSERVESEARNNAQRVTGEAQEAAKRVTSEAESRAADVQRQATARRAELFAELEQERDQLQDAVGQLRAFEANYRQTFTSHLKQQLQAVEQVSLEPASRPALADDDRNAPSGGRRAQQSEAQGSSDQGATGRSTAGGSQGPRANPSSTPRLDALLGENQRNS